MKLRIIVSSMLALAALGLFFHSADDGGKPPNLAIPFKKTEAPCENFEADAEPEVASIRPEDLGVRPRGGNYDHPARIREIIEAGDMTSLQSATLSWFEHDPAAARDWLAAQPSLEEFQPSISYIAHHISEGGDLALALEWAALLTDVTLHDDTVFDIHALAIRNGRLSPADIPVGLIEEARMEELLNGAPGD
jgi:hypothetical protein